MGTLNRILISVVLMFFCAVAHSASTSQWVLLKSDSKGAVKEIIKSEVDKRDGYSSAQEESSNYRIATDEQAREDAAYKNSLAAAKADFTKSKNRRDDLMAQFQSKSTELEDVQKEIKNHKASMDNYDSQIVRFEQDIKAQQESLKKWLKTEKQGEALVAVIYTRGFKDKKHDLDGLADNVSAPLMAEEMGTYIRSYTTVVNNVLKEDFIQAVTEGTAKWNGEEPFLVELGKGTSGTAYLRLKRYELYPFQETKNGKNKTGNGVERMKVAIIGSMYDLETLLSQNAYSTANLDLSRVQSLLAETAQSKKLAGEGLTEQVNSYKEKITALQEKIVNARSDKESQTVALKRKDAQLEKLKAGFETLRVKKGDTEKAFITAQATLQDKNRVRETIIIKTVLSTFKGSQTPAESASESIIDKLEEVKNDARTQHSTSTTTVVNAQLVDETSLQAVTEAKITGVKLISFINEGDSVKVKMAFRVKMELGDLNQNNDINSINEAGNFQFAEQTALDTRTGLMWARDGYIPGKEMTWSDAKEWVKKLTYGGYSDWRLPTEDELLSLAKRGGDHPFEWLKFNGFNNVKDSCYLSSTSRSSNSNGNTYTYVNHVSMGSGKVYTYNSKGSYYVWPVRNGVRMELRDLVAAKKQDNRTDINNEKSKTKRDGFKFRDNDVVVYERTGLMWARNGNIAGKEMNWQDAKNWVETLSIGGYHDWRLPTKNELLALAKHGGDGPAQYFNTNGFINIQLRWYWSSDRRYGFDSGASIVGMEAGNVGFDNLGSNNYVWPVRGGK